MSVKFPTPWEIIEVGPCELLVNDATGRKLFYIHSDEGQEGEGQDRIEPSVLEFGTNEEHAALCDQLGRLFGGDHETTIG